MPDMKITGKSILCEFPNGDQMLVGTVEIDCPVCGPLKMTIHGHHMRSLLLLLAEWVEAHPTLTGPTEVKEVARERWEGTTGGDPTVN